MDQKPKCKARYYKTLTENIGRTLFDINHCKILFDPPPRIMKIKTEINVKYLNLKALHSTGKL